MTAETTNPFPPGDPHWQAWENAEAREPSTSGYDADLWPDGWELDEATAPPTEPTLRIDPPPARLDNLPEAFWKTRPLFEHIRQAAHAQGRAADAVFAAALARASAMVAPELRFNFGLGNGSLNLFVALVGPSGAGKSQAVTLAGDLLPRPRHLTDDAQFRDGVGLGSGEGMAEAYMGTIERETGELHKSGPNRGDPKVERVRAQARSNVFFYLDEGEALTKQLERAGVTIGTAIRSAWAGKTLGQQNAREETTRTISTGTYSMGMVIGYQLDTCQPLLSDVGPGTPQRFLWFPATDPSVPDEPPEEPGPLPVMLEQIDGRAITGTITCDQSIRRELWERNLAGVRGTAQVDNQDSHAPLMRCKISCLLAILDGRIHVTEEDWELALVIWDASCAVRDRLIQFGIEVLEREKQARTEAHVEREVAVHAAKRSVDSSVERLARWISRRLHQDRAPETRGQMRKQAQAKDRPFFDAALDHAVEMQWAVVGEDRLIKPGPARVEKGGDLHPVPPVAKSQSRRVAE